MRILLPLLVFGAACGARAADLSATLRGPAAVVFSEQDQRWLYVANERSGTISVIDLRDPRVAGEVEAGGRLSDLVGGPPQRLLAVDQDRHHLLIVAADGADVRVLQRLPVARHPVGVTLLADRRQAVVSSLWSRRLTFVDLGERPQVLGQLDMPWAPRRLLALPDGPLLVADSFGGRVAVVDPQARRLLHQRQFPAHNIRGLGRSHDGKMLLIAHQMLNELAHTVRNDVHWGLLMSNDLRWIPLERMLAAEGDLYRGAHMHPLGEAGSATADPSALAVAADGTVVIALGGVGEIAVGRETDFSLHRIEVGRRPAAVAVTPDSRLAAVANMFDDTVSLVDLPNRRVTETVSLGPGRELTLAEQGEQLFYDGGLSHDRWMSCHSCHTDGHTNGQLNDNLSDTTFGAPKRVLSLLGKRGTEPFAWNAGAKDYAEQIFKSVTQTMQSDKEPSDEQIKALAAYLETLPPPPSIDAARGTVDAAAVARGRELFSSLDCSRCHAPPSYTTPELYDVGLEDQLGGRQFNPPALLGVGQRGPYFHDGRAKSLRNVFQKHGHQLDQPLDEASLGDLLAFLRSL